MSPQQSIAHYRIVSKLGEGGMGAVFRATDTKLNRDVAIKILPDSFAADPDRLARFTREAQVLASLNHPNIAAIYGVEERALVLELVDGPTLAERIAAGPLPLDEALPIARQIAEALEYAHDRGIIHRDLKPANVKVTPEDRVKVLDFGLAKALAADLGASDPMSSPTITMRATMAGVIMGTAGYMSPEQAKGKPVDRRADIWAFGVLLVEMLTGAMMYTGETVSDTLASVIKDQPDLSKLPAGTPPSIRRLIKRCLDKDPQRRLQAIGEARILIDEAPAEDPAAPVSAAVAPAVRRGAPWWTVALAALLPAAILGAVLWRATQPADRPLERFVADLGPDAVTGPNISVAISPDGRRIVHRVHTPTGNALATRLMDQDKATVLSGTEHAVDPFFSPDGQWIGFSVLGRLQKVSVHGGTPIFLCDAPSVRGAYWAEDGFIYADISSAELFRIPQGGGKPVQVTRPADSGERTDRWPQMLPGGDLVLVTSSASRNNYDDADLTVCSLKTGKRKVVMRGGYSGRYIPGGRLVYVHGGTLFAVAFDLGKLETRGTPIPVLDDVAGNPGQGGGQFDLASNGTMVYLAGKSVRRNVNLVWLDKSGATQSILAESTPMQTPRLSPDGKLIAGALERDLVVHDPARGSTAHISTANDASTGVAYPIWMPDGKHIISSGAGAGIWWSRSDGSSKPERIYPKNAIAQSVSPDGRTLAWHESGDGRDLYTAPLDLTDPDHAKIGKPQPFALGRGAQVDPAFSPDGRWLAYTSNESGSDHVFVRPFPEGAQAAGQVQISAAPGRFPLWSRTSRELFYVTQGDTRIMVVPYTIEGRTFSPGKPQVWCDTPILVDGVNMPLDIAPDGKRFVVSLPRDLSGGAEKVNLHVTFLLNFFDELRRRIP